MDILGEEEFLQFRGMMQEILEDTPINRGYDD
jgi:hypothetical protein